MKRVSRVKGLENDEVQGLAIQADQLQEFHTIASSPEGRTLIQTLMKDYVLKAQALHGMYRESSRDSIVSIIASMEASWDTARLLTTSEELLKYLDTEINNALTE